MLRVTKIEKCPHCSSENIVKNGFTKSWPLYYYAPAVNGVNTPELAGETKGENVNNVWFVGKN